MAVAVIIVTFELIDTLTTNGTNDTREEAEAAQMGITGLIKVAVFLGVPSAAATETQVRSVSFLMPVLRSIFAATNRPRSRSHPASRASLIESR